MLAEVPYGQECPNDSRIKKTSYRTCETCGFRKFLGKTFATCSWSPKVSPTEKMTEEEIIKDLMEFIPKDDLTKEEFNEAKRIWEASRFSLDVVKYIHSIRQEEGLKWAKGYFDLYIDDRHYDNR